MRGAARAHSLAALASEEWAKACAVLTLSFMPAAVRARVPVREFLEGHRLKIVASQLLHLLDGARPGVADRLAGMTELADTLAPLNGRPIVLTRPSNAASTWISWRTGRFRCLRVSAGMRHQRRFAEALSGSWADAQDVIGDADAAADLLRGLISPLATPMASPEA